MLEYDSLNKQDLSGDLKKVMQCTRTGSVLAESQMLASHVILMPHNIRPNITYLALLVVTARPFTRSLLE